MTEGRSLDAHAYVDGCLPASERVAFEAAMTRDARLRARVDAWRAQNEALQAAFGAARPRATPPARPSNENRSPSRARPRAPARPSRLRAGLAALACGVALLWPGGLPVDPRSALALRAEAALRALAARPAPAFDFASADPAATAAWLAPLTPGLRADALRAPGWTLQGVRLTPGGAGAAALVVFENALGDRAGLLLERNDASPDWPARWEPRADLVVLAGARGGLDFALVGPRGSGAAALAPRAVQPPL